MKRIMKRNVESEIPTIEEVFTEFINQKKAENKSKSTIVNYQKSYGFYMQYNEFTEETTVDKITDKSIYSWSSSMLDEGKRISTINHYIRDLRAFIYYCMEQEHIKEFKVREVKGQEAQIKIYTDEELQILLEKPKRKSTFVENRTWIIVNWILGTANRASTVCNIKIEDVNFKKSEIYLRHTKNKKSQTIPLSTELKKKLKQYIKTWIVDTNGGYKSEYLFPKADGTQLNTNALHLSYKKYCNDRGIQRSNIHGLRHNYALQYLQNNGQLFKLQKILGHSDLAMVRRYVRLSSDDVKQDYDRYSPLDTLTRNKSRTQTMKRNNYDDEE